MADKERSSPTAASGGGALAAARLEIARLQAALVEAEARERALAQDVQHRVRNMLAMIRSVARQSWEAGASQQDYAQHFHGRLDAIGRYQTRAGYLRAIGLDLEDIVRDELIQTHCLDGPRCSIAGPPVRLHGREAELVGLALHELATNAIKFGAFAGEGRLAVRWSVTDALLHFRWIETGVAIASPAPRRSGFGQQLIESALPYELGATTAFDLKPGGLACTINLSLASADINAAEQSR